MDNHLKLTKNPWIVQQSKTRKFSLLYTVKSPQENTIPMADIGAREFF